MKRLSTFLVFVFLGFTSVKAQTDLLYVAGQNDATPGDAPTLYVQGGADLYVEGGVVASGSNTRSSEDGLLQVVGTLHIGDYSGVGPGNWTNSTTTDLYTYNNSTLPSAFTYAPGTTITYGATANAVSLEYGNQLIQGATSAAKTHFFVLSLLDQPAIDNFKTMVNADIYVGVTSLNAGGLDLNDEYLMTQNNTIHVENPSTAASGTSFAISRLQGGSLANTPPFFPDTTGGMVVASNVDASPSEPAGRLAWVTNANTAYNFPVGSLKDVPAPNTGQNFGLFRPVAITPPPSASNTEFAAALVPDDGFADAGTALDQQYTSYHSIAGINHQYYHKINQTTGTPTNTAQITVYHIFATNSIADQYPNWSTCGNLPSQDFPQTLTIAQWDNNGTNMSWNDVCHNNNPATNTFTDLASSCGTGLTVTPNNDFCNSTVVPGAPYIDNTSTVAYQIPGGYTSSAPGTSAQEDYVVAGLFFSVDGGNGSCDGNCAALPLNIISLNGWNENDGNHLQWITATEENTDYFIVEKSIDGANWTALNSANPVPAAGFSSKQITYNYIDPNPNMGDNYYRVREVYYNDQNMATNVINVPLTKQIAIANVYPNPTSGVLNVDFVTSKAGTVHMEVYDVLGRLMLSSDNGVETGNNSIVVNTTNLTAGSYFIRITDTESNFTDTQKFIKITQ